MYRFMKNMDFLLWKMVQQYRLLILYASHILLTHAEIYDTFFKKIMFHEGAESFLICRAYLE